LTRSSCTWSSGTFFTPSGLNIINLVCTGGNWEITLDVDLAFHSCWVIGVWEGSVQACGDGTCPPLGPIALTFQGGGDPCLGSPVITLS
jgi:hypothetical protein